MARENARAIAIAPPALPLLFDRSWDEHVIGQGRRKSWAMALRILGAGVLAHTKLR